jgi:hypothetical protein
VGQIKNVEWLRLRNKGAAARLLAAVPAHFPKPVLRHALAARWIPELPSRAVEFYWRATRCAPIGLPGRSPAAAARRRAGTGARARASGRRRRRTATRALPGGRGIAAFAASRCSALAGTAILPAPAARAAGSGTRPASRRGSSGTRGRRLLRGAEVDHRVPLFQVRRERQDLAWPDLLTFWGAPNLQVVNRAAHVAKCSAETAERARLRAAAQLPAAPTA